MADYFQPLPSRAVPPTDADLAPPDRYAEVSLRKADARQPNIRWVILAVSAVAIAMLTLVGYVAWRFGPRQGSTFITVSSPIGATKVVDKGNLVREFVFVDRKLQGTWVATSMVINGEMAIDDDLAKVQVTFDDRGKFNMAMPDGNWTGLAGTPANLRPKPMFFIVRNGPEDFRARVGVCEVNDDILRICVKWTPVERREDGATDFIAEKGSGRILLIMKRQEKEP